MHFERPEEPSDHKEETRQAADEVAEAIRSGHSPVFRESLWQRYKGRFAVAQHSKCAFCEMSIANHDSAIDHFAPKGEVSELSENKDERGYEHEAGLPNIRDRKIDRKIDFGYWWLAYEWRNFLVVCSACNTKWKHSLFPVKSALRRWPPSPEVTEEPLLINPFDEPAPWRHFRFDEFGRMIATPGSDKGEATIDTLGFDTLPSDGTSRRAALSQRRVGPAQDAHVHARVFVHHSLAERYDLAAYALENLYRLGGADRDHAGMVRAIAEHVTGFTWDKLMDIHGVNQMASRSPGSAS